MVEQTRSGGRILVDNLLAQGCDRIFCVPGESYLAVLDALHDTPAIDLVVCRQEGGAAYMAEADGKLTGRPGICFVTRGPGATNAAIGVHVARQDSTPMILFIGDVAREAKDREGFQEIDFPAMFAPLAKWAAKIDDARRIPEYVARAYAVAMSGRPGPVVLALPEDMLLDEVAAVDRPEIVRTRQSVWGMEVAVDIGDLLRSAARPVAIVGGADWNQETGRALAEWAEHSGVPIVAAFRRQDAIDNTSPAYAGNLGYGPNPKLVERVRNADVILVIGARLGEATTDGYTLITPDHPGQTLIHVHPDPDELQSVYHADIAMCCSVDDFCNTLADNKKHWPNKHSSGAVARAEYLEWNSPKPREGVRLDLCPCVAAMREALPTDTVICNGAGNYSGWWHRYWRYGPRGTQLAPTNGSMGYGIPAAVAAGLRTPERRIVALAGDGCFLMNGQELATAVGQGLQLLVIVVDNASYGTIRMHQEREYPHRLSGTKLANPDFAALARAYGGWAETIDRTEDFAPALARAIDQPGLALLHLRTDIEQITPALVLSQMNPR